LQLFNCRQFVSTLLSVVALVAAGSVSAASITVYDDTAANTPGLQPWLFAADDGFFSGGSVTETALAAGVNLVSDNAVSAGYSNYNPFTSSFKNAAFPLLDRDQGFSVSFALDIASEAHSSNDRAGFSVILLGEDLLGIELGFWVDEVWAQNDTPLFSHGEGALFDTTAGEVLYELAILGSSYALTADGNALLQGSLRDYSAFSGPFGGAPYDLPSYLFLGDDTGSAAANIVLGEVIVSTNEPAAVSTPAVALLLLSGLLLLRRWRGISGRGARV
jgi:hypothetical protein